MPSGQPPLSRLAEESSRGDEAPTAGRLPRQLRPSLGTQTWEVGERIEAAGTEPQLPSRDLGRLDGRDAWTLEPFRLRTRLRRRPQQRLRRGTRRPPAQRTCRLRSSGFHLLRSRLPDNLWPRTVPCVCSSPPTAAAADGDWGPPRLPPLHRPGDRCRHRASRGRVIVIRTVAFYGLVWYRCTTVYAANTRTYGPIRRWTFTCHPLPVTVPVHGR